MANADDADECGGRELIDPKATPPNPAEHKKFTATIPQPPKEWTPQDEAVLGVGGADQSRTR